jgi:hypothetical protein
MDLESRSVLDPTKLDLYVEIQQSYVCAKEGLQCQTNKYDS